MIMQEGTTDLLFLLLRVYVEFNFCFLSILMFGSWSFLGRGGVLDLGSMFDFVGLGYISALKYHWVVPPYYLSSMDALRGGCH